MGAVWKINKFGIKEDNNKVFGRSCIIMEKDIGTEFGVHNGKDFFIFTVQAEMVGFKFGDFALTRKYPKVPLKWLKAKKKFN